MDYIFPTFESWFKELADITQNHFRNFHESNQLIWQKTVFIGRNY